MIFIGIGSNLPGALGGSAEMVEAAISALNDAPLRLLARSALWRTRPVPDQGEPWFVNAVAAIATGLEPGALLDYLLAMEHGFGRERTWRNAPRVLDLDLIDYNGHVSGDDEIPNLPHPRLGQRAFVLKPLAQIAPAWQHPVSGDTLAELIDRLPEDQFAEPILA